MVKPIKRLQIGKKGLTPEFVGQIRSAFKNESIVKITLLKSACRNKKDAEEIGKQIVNALGRNFDYKIIGYVLTVMRFRRNKE